MYDAAVIKDSYNIFSELHYVPNDIDRLGKPEEIAGAVAYLVSSYADYINGAVLRVDGGTVKSVA